MALAGGGLLLSSAGPVRAQVAQPALDVCSGVSVNLPVLNQVPGVAVGAIGALPILGGLGLTLDTSPIAAQLNTVVGNVNANLTNALSGQPLSVRALDSNGNVIALPSSGCSVAVTSPNGITLGGGRIDGLGGNGNPQASAGDPSAIAIGNGASTPAGVANATAFGTGASATTAGAVALGSGSVANRLNSGAELFSGTGLRTTLGVASVGSPTNERQITNVGGGTADTDAVNVRQLRTVGTGLATSLGGGAGFDPATGAYTAPTYTVRGTGYTNVGGAIGALDTAVGTNATSITNLTANITNGTIGLVQQDPTTRVITVGAGTNGGVVNVAGTAGARRITGVAAGTGGTDAVNLTQLTNAVSGVTPGALAIASENSGGAPVPTATGLRSVAAGYGSVATAPDTFSLGAVGAERRLVNVRAGTVAAGSTDGVNGGQLFATRQGVVGTTATLGGGAAFDPTTGAFTAPNYTIRGTTYTNVGSALSALDSAITPGGGGPTVPFTANSTTDTLAPRATGDNSVAGGFDARALGASSTALGDQATAAADSASSFGERAMAAGVGSAAFGNLSQAMSANTTAIGTSAVANFEGSTAIGFGARAIADPTTAVGFQALASGNDAAAVGASASATGNESTAVGHTANASGANSTAIGSESIASADGSVAIGKGAVADRLNAVSEAFTGAGLRTTLGTVSVGSAGNERQVTNVAGGTADTDAVNVRQLRSVGTNLATSLGGGAAFDAATGTYTAPTYTVSGMNFRDVGSAIGALDTMGVKYDIDPATGQKGNSMTLVGGDPNTPVLIRNVANGIAPTDAANVGQVRAAVQESKAYTDQQIASSLGNVQSLAALGQQVRQVRREARQAAALGLAAGSLRYDSTPGKISLAAGGGAWQGEAGAAFGIGYTSPDGFARVNLSASTSDGKWGVGGGLSLTLN